MPKQHVVSVGFSFPGDDVESVSITDDKSLLDADLIIFEPTLSGLHGGTDSYKGKPCFSDYNSAQYLQAVQHWHSQLEIAAEAGKTIIVFLSRNEEAFYHTGNYQNETVGRKGIRSRIVAPASNYSMLPFPLGKLVFATGDKIKPLKSNAAFDTYWNSFRENFEYQAFIQESKLTPIFVTLNGDKIVGGSMKWKKGFIICLPTLGFDHDSFLSDDDDETWTKEGIKFGKRLLSCLLAIDLATRESSAATPAPEWVLGLDYKLRSETELERHISQINEKISGLENQKSKTLAELSQVTCLKDLLFEKGDRLEAAVRLALNILGFAAANFKTHESEFDALFTSPEGTRFLGEVEGRDNKQIAIEKMSQLERNIQEDFARPEISEYAKPVLFGNANRLSPLSQRDEFFTEKVIKAAERCGAALVRTPDLFFAAKHVHEYGNQTYAAECRRAFSESPGRIVEFPSVSKS